MEHSHGVKPRRIGEGQSAYEQDELQHFDLARFLIARTIPSERGAR